MVNIPPIEMVIWGWFIVVLPTLIDNPTTMNNHGLYVMDIDIDM